MLFLKIYGIGMLTMLIWQLLAANYFANKAKKMLRKKVQDGLFNPETDDVEAFLRKNNRFLNEWVGHEMVNGKPNDPAGIILLSSLIWWIAWPVVIYDSISEYCTSRHSKKIDSFKNELKVLANPTNASNAALSRVRMTGEEKVQEVYIKTS